MCQPDDDTYRNKTHPLWSYERGCIHHTCIFCFWSQPPIHFVVFVNNERIHSTHFAFYLCISHTFYSNTQENHWNAHGCVIIFFSIYFGSQFRFVSLTTTHWQSVLSAGRDPMCLLIPCGLGDVDTALTGWTEARFTLTQVWFEACAKLLRDVVAKQCRLSLAARKHKISPANIISRPRKIGSTVDCENEGDKLEIDWETRCYIHSLSD